MKESSFGQEGLAIETHGLVKNFGSVRAVRNVDLRVRSGEIYGFLGRNGAGKTTTIRILLGLIRPDAGEARILGSSLREDRRGVLSRLGFFVETPTAYPNLTARENLEIQRRLTGAPPRGLREAIDLLGLGEYADRKAGTLSLGNKQRLSIARALLHKPRLLILDEPVNGLDPAGIVEIRELLRRLSRGEGITIFMSSHNLAEVDRLADRIGIVHEGRLVEELDAGDFRDKKLEAIEVEVDDVDRAEKALRGLSPSAAIERRGDSGLRVSSEGIEAAEVARVLVGAGIGLKRLVVAGEGLEEHFLRLTGGNE